jgi:hydroxyacylglutathione hydrolase
LPRNGDRPVAHPLDIACLPVGPYQANCYLACLKGHDECLVIDPGEEPESIQGKIADRRLAPVGVLVTHGHIDHIGAVAPVARWANSAVYMAADDAHWLRELAPELEPDVLVRGGERLEIGPFTVDVLAVPGHSPGHVAFLIEGVLFSGDVLFQGSVGRVDLPGGDWPTLERSLHRLVHELPGDTVVLPGHGPATTLAEEARTNPFLTGAVRP